jgi:TonB family protein
MKQFAQLFSFLIFQSEGIWNTSSGMASELISVTFIVWGQLQSSATPKHPVSAASLDMVSDKDGIDFNAYLREVYFSVKRSWVGYNMPPSIEKGLQGKNTVEFRILPDGNIQKDSLKMITSAQKSELDTASLAAVREAAPFSHLPKNFSEPFIVLRMTFYYNLLPQKSK